MSLLPASLSQGLARRSWHLRGPQACLPQSRGRTAGLGSHVPPAWAERRREGSRGESAAPKEGAPPPPPLSLSTARASPGLDEQLFRSVEGQAASDEDNDCEKWREAQRPPAEVTALLAVLSGCGRGYVLRRERPGWGIPGAGPPWSSWEHRAAPLCSDGPGTWRLTS